jgi:hypothetical protein
MTYCSFPYDYFPEHIVTETQTASEYYDLGFNVDELIEFNPLLLEKNTVEILPPEIENCPDVSNLEIEGSKTKGSDKNTSPGLKTKVICKNPASEKKNIHRYITRQIIRALISDECRKQLLKICEKLKIPVDDVVDYFE